MMMLGIPELLVVGVWIAILIVALAAIVWPARRVLGRLGFSPWLALLVLVPAVNVVLLWIVAYAPWPGDDPRRAV